jgi:hypothetical protein
MYGLLMRLAYPLDPAVVLRGASKSALQVQISDHITQIGFDPSE